ncbi:hypothetical protein [Desulfospira joergensenii]|uniref:hypothetical protein n=1 Tax=Desulfospira joergensenii TaxID=53329 RepID=UPI0003B51BB0|nr:hypothetical protein [Desulfospira joergensenii]
MDEDQINLKFSNPPEIPVEDDSEQIRKKGHGRPGLHVLTAGCGIRALDGWIRKSLTFPGSLTN